VALFRIEIDWWHGFLDFLNILFAYVLALPIGGIG
jgi:hypothetical protein